MQQMSNSLICISEHHNYGENLEYHQDLAGLAGLSTFFKGQKKADKECVGIVEGEGGTYLRSSYFIGVDWLLEKEKAIYVQPKVNSKGRQLDYLRMISEALQTPGVGHHATEIFEIKYDSPQIEIEEYQDLLTPLLVIQFLSLVQRIVKKGLKRSYYHVEENLFGRVKGKVLVTETIKHSLNRKPASISCRFQEFGLNSTENKILKKAISFCDKYVSSGALKGQGYFIDTLRYIKPAFQQVSSEVDVREIKKLKKNVFFKEYNDALELAQRLLKRFSYNIHNTDNSEKRVITTPPFWIDMSLLFELYVLGQLRKVYGNGVLYEEHEVRGYTGIPDFLLVEPWKIIIDTKYKPRYENGEISSKDVRQLSGYARDMKVRRNMGIKEIDPPEILKCLVIYPSSIEDYPKPLADLEARKPSTSYLHFYKIGVELPGITPSK